VIRLCETTVQVGPRRPRLRSGGELHRARVLRTHPIYGCGTEPL